MFILCYTTFEVMIMKKKLAITLDDKIVEQLKELADKEGRSISSLINKILMDYFEQYLKSVK